jgi:hypothetical protein
VQIEEYAAIGGVIMNTVLSLVLTMAVMSQYSYANGNCVLRLEAPGSQYVLSFGTEDFEQHLLKRGWVLSSDASGHRVSGTLRLKAKLEDWSKTQWFETWTRAEYRITGELQIARQRAKALDATGTFRMPDRLSGGCGNDFSDPALMRAARKIRRQILRALPDCSTLGEHDSVEE